MYAIIDISSQQIKEVVDKTFYDKTNIYSFTDQEKSIELGDSTIMSICGESGDVMQFGQYIQKNLQLYKMRNGYELSPKGMAHYTRRQISDSLRKNVCC